MHPYLSQQLGAAHRENLVRVAASRNFYRDNRLPTHWDALVAQAQAHAHAPVRSARQRTGALLVRAGQRLGGLDTFSVGLSAGPTGPAC